MQSSCGQVSKGQVIQMEFGSKLGGQGSHCWMEMEIEENIGGNIFISIFKLFLVKFAFKKEFIIFTVAVLARKLVAFLTRKKKK